MYFCVESPGNSTSSTTLSGHSIQARIMLYMQNQVIGRVEKIRLVYKPTDSERIRTVSFNLMILQDEQGVIPYSRLRTTQMLQEGYILNSWALTPCKSTDRIWESKLTLSNLSQSHGRWRNLRSQSTNAELDMNFFLALPQRLQIKIEGLRKWYA